MLPATDNANHMNVFKASVFIKSARLHNGLKNSRRTFEQEFRWLSHSDGNDDLRHSALQGHKDVGVLELRLIQTYELALKFPQSFSLRGHLPDHRQTNFAVGS